MAILTAAKTVIQELRRTGAATEQNLQKFEWDANTHSGMQDDHEYELEVKTGRRVLPGSDEVVEHVMSSSWKPFDFGGEWDDKWAGADFAWNTNLALAKMVGRGPLVRLTLDEHSWVGILTNLRIKYRHRAHIHWALTMSPHKNEAVGSFRGVAPVAHETRSSDQWAQDLSGQNESIINRLDDAKQLQMSTEDVSNVSDQTAEIADAVARITAVNTAGLQTDATRQLLQMATAFRRAHGASISIQASVATLTSSSVAFTDVLQRLRFDAWRCGTHVDAVQASGLARKAELDMRARAQLKPKAIYRPQAGEPLERIALKFYGAGDAWRTIYDANHLDTLVLDGTEQLIIPERTA